MHTITWLIVTLGLSTSTFGRLNHSHSRLNKRHHHELAARAPFPALSLGDSDPSADHLDKRGDYSLDSVGAALKLSFSDVATYSAPASQAVPAQAASLFAGPTAEELASAKAAKALKEKKAAAKARHEAASKAFAARVKSAENARAKKAALIKSKAEAAEKKAEEEAAAAKAKKVAAKKASETAAEKAAKKAAKEAAKKAAEVKAAAEIAAKKKPAAKKKTASVQTKLSVVSDDGGDSSSSASTGKGLIGFVSENCGPSGATEEFPNGSESFLNCGISKSNPDSGWTPPKGIRLDHIATVSIEEALAKNPIWAPCAKFTELFEKVAEKTNLPPILLMALALQESTCMEDTIGDSGGAFGLMQITETKCGGRNAKDCSAPEYNVLTGAQYLRDEIDRQNGAFLVALGQYNGWYPGLSYNIAIAPAKEGHCEWQQNLDYFEQVLNGWLLGRTGYTMGSMKNLANCH
ncbi:BZ3500_MvSof-1268-A1-R1_Chr4-3g07337 [Microbotryum saponariae]|uniref:BZ3500_MvSof-1268-A1-R1_Chr4-3g07337 protein n=1 Tax=Microbotryum saponariae TaxID=289078 RepID=A0A2X0LNP4_9BASI|nr:BZ3500_MvSof-1268-A1-R1_Chr4-3g07337 [Microbotryum saponariae]SDA07000.1 BZ3501_MvSof-1269-A2-R1_Chr4-2g07046 [Microbotryum saponariae]